MTNKEIKDSLSSCGLWFERKTITDFWDSIKTNKIDRQVDEMIEGYRSRCALIIEGNYIPKYLKKIENIKLMLKNKRNSLSWKLPVMLTYSKKDTVREMLRMYDKFVNNELGMLDRRIEIYDRDKVNNFLRGIPGVGSEVAPAIKSEFKSFKDLVLNPKKLREIEVGGTKLKKRATKIKRFLNQKW